MPTRSMRALDAFDGIAVRSGFTSEQLCTTMNGHSAAANLRLIRKAVVNIDHSV